MSHGHALLWLRQDLRVADSPALVAALAEYRSVTAVYIAQEAGTRPIGGATAWWLHGSLEALEAELAALRIPLVLRSGDPVAEITSIIRDGGIDALFWARRYGEAEYGNDVAVALAARELGIPTTVAGPSLLCEPQRIRTGAGTGYAVFTPFAKAVRTQLSIDPPRIPLPVPAPARTPAARLHSLTLADLGLRTAPTGWHAGLAATWTPGERGAQDTLADFLDEGVHEYADRRDRVDLNVPSRLSPALHFGEISPQQIMHALEPFTHAPTPVGAEFSRQLLWREFAYHQLDGFGDLATRNWRERFDSFEWPETDPKQLLAWQQGRTGIPLVDAGMRELWATGTMHGRARMVTASFLTKNLLIHWRLGEKWFWDTLVDADAAANPFNWQWIAGSGADAAPYFRIFNPVLQGERFDPQERYVRRWVPEWGTAAYPAPIVDLKATRARALELYQRLPR